MEDGFTAADRDDGQACRPVLPPRLRASESGCRETPTSHARWSRAVVGDSVANQVKSDADPMIWFAPLKVTDSSSHKRLQTSRFLNL
jgi:hypothetical protein